MIYTAEYVGKDGFTVTIKGTIQQCANWADNVIRAHGEGLITIKSEDKNDDVER